MQWSKELPKLAAAGVKGPLFISVGSFEQLAKFLELNPEIDQTSALVDPSSDFAAYRAAGFTNLMGDTQLESAPDFKPPRDMSPGRWWSYLRNVMALSPKPEKVGEFPQGVKVLGGTYVIDGDDVVFDHQDVVPGATPDISAVLAAAGVRA